MGLRRLGPLSTNHHAGLRYHEHTTSPQADLVWGERFLFGLPRESAVVSVHVEVHQQRGILKGGPFPVASGTWKGNLDEVFAGCGGKGRLLKLPLTLDPRITRTGRAAEDLEVGATGGGPFLDLRIEAMDRSDVAGYLKRVVQGGHDSEGDEDSESTRGRP